ncbi:MAG: AI-2E family transporter [Caldilineaceae bacterium]
MANDHLAELAQTAVSFTQSLTNIASQLLLRSFLSIYWTADRLRFERLWLSLLPTEQRIHARAIWRRLEDGVGAYTRSELTQSILAGGLLTVGYWLLGIPYPFLLALQVALAWLIPLVGGLIAMIPLLLVAWLYGISPILLGAIFLTVAVLALMEFGVERMLYHDSRYQRVLVLLVMIALVDVYGVLGLLIAPFLATAIQIFLSKLMATISTNKPIAISQSIQTDLSTLQERLQEVQSALHQDEATEQAPTTKRLSNLTARLSTLLEETAAIETASPQPISSQNKA